MSAVPRSIHCCLEEWPQPAPRAECSKQELSAGRVALWYGSLEASPESLLELRRLLDPVECARADRYLVPGKRRQFIVARAILRQLLGGYLAIDPAAVQFDYGEHGKPHLADRALGLEFNVSHSGERLLLGFVRDAEIGLDIEQMHGRGTNRKIAERFFSPAEVARYLDLAEGERARGFFRCWTRKEAYLKIKGRGLSLPLDSFEVTLGPDEPPRLVETRTDRHELSQIALHEIAVDPGYMAALMLRSTNAQLSSTQIELDRFRFTL